MFESKLKIGLYTVLVPIISSIGYYFYNFSKKREFNEVLWTNHLSQSCEFSREEHLQNNKLCRKNCCSIATTQKIINFINNATYSIDLAMHIFTFREIADAIARAKKRNVRIRIICCNLQRGSTGSNCLSLIDKGIPIRFQINEGGELMHHKFCIIDGKRRIKSLKKNANLKFTTEPDTILITGSCNWTRQGFNINWENIVITSNNDLADQFEQEYERMWMTFERH